MFPSFRSGFKNRNSVDRLPTNAPRELFSMWFLVPICCALGYLFGSFPAGYFAGRLAGLDVRTAGSGNIGATNVLRTLGKRWGYPVFVIDAFKGFAAVRLAYFLVNFWPSAK